MDYRQKLIQERDQLKDDLFKGTNQTNVNWNWVENVKNQIHIQEKIIENYDNERIELEKNKSHPLKRRYSETGFY